MKPITIPLKSTITLGEGEKAVTYTEFTFAREAEVGDVIASETFNGDTARAAAILASIAGVPFQAMRKAKLADFNEIMEKTAHLLGNGPAPAGTGAA